MRGNTPFMLLPGKQVLFNLSKKSVMPLDCLFNENKTAPPCNALTKMIEVMANKNNLCESEKDNNIYKMIIVLHIEEINVQSRHLF